MFTFGSLQLIPACLASAIAMTTKAVKVIWGSSPRRPPWGYMQIFKINVSIYLFTHFVIFFKKKLIIYTNIKAPPSVKVESVTSKKRKGIVKQKT